MSNTRRENAESILRDEEYNFNEWGGSVTLVELANARYAVCIKRENDCWVEQAADLNDVAHHFVGCQNTEHEVEWIAAVIDLDTGERVPLHVEEHVSILHPKTQDELGRYNTGPLPLTH